MRKTFYIYKKNITELWVIVAFGFLVALLGLVAVMASQTIEPFWKGFLSTPLAALVFFCVFLFVIGNDDEMLVREYRWKVEGVR